MAVPLSSLGSSAVAGAAASATTCGTAGDSTEAQLAGGSYTTVTVAGNCFVNAGDVVTSGDVTIQPGAVLTAVFADNSGGPGSSNLTVGGNIIVENSGSLIMGVVPIPRSTCPVSTTRAAT
jgi:hypothetical protein